MNVRVNTALKRRLKKLSSRIDEPMSRIVKDMLDEKLVIEEASARQDWPVPDWVPIGKYVALVKGSVVAVGESPSDVLDEATSKFRDQAIQIKLKGRPTPKFQYAFFASPQLLCWRYVLFGEDEYPVVPCTIVGEKSVDAGGMLDSGASISLAGSDLIRRAGLKHVRREIVQTGGGAVELEIFTGELGVAEGRHHVEIGEVDLPREFPVKLLLGRNILDSLDAYLLGKKRVVCVRDP